MKFIKSLFWFPIILVALVAAAQTKVLYKEETHASNGFSYTSVTNDPLNARVYTLKNGLKAYLSVYKDAPRIQTYIAVKAGSKNDPADATGLAHYLEHILFKGTSKIGSYDWPKEKIELQKIENLFEKYKGVKDATSRANLYHQIDSVSKVAANYAIANEYDKLLSSIGAAGTNAYTSVEQTIYVNDIPANQVEKWLKIEGERFKEVVPRLFHTELEAVYEEKNRGLDNDQWKSWEAMNKALFPTHPYGTQTTIGTVEHLKNPSITAIKKYFNTYYVPNNMAICMSGDLNPDSTIKYIDKYFGDYPSKPVPKFVPAQELPIVLSAPLMVSGPDAEYINLAYRLPGVKDRNSKMSELLAQILSNGQAGLMDLNLNQQQKVLSAYAYPMRLNDYTAFIIGGKPRQGQSLEEVKKLMLHQLELVKKGEFADWMLEAINNDYKLKRLRSYESNRARADALTDAFISQRTWEEYLNEFNDIQHFTKQEIVTFANNFFNTNYVEVRKLQGTDTTIEKVIKPIISPVEVNRDKQSEFLKQINAQTNSQIKPVFIDYSKDLSNLNLKKGIPIVYKHNVENDLFSLNYVVDIGRDHDPKFALAVDYLDYLGFGKYTNEKLKEEFFKLGCNYGISVTSDATYLTLSGLNQNFNAALKLFEDLIAQPAADNKALTSMVDGILKVRADNKANKEVIHRSAMVSYAKYGPTSPFRNILSAEALHALKDEELIDIIKSLTRFEHRVLYYGPLTEKKLTSALQKIHNTPQTLATVPAQKKFGFADIAENKVLYVNYPMVQAEVIILSKSVPYNKLLLPKVTLFNEYFGGSMGSLVFQELRESRALAYSVNSRYQNASRKNDPNFISSYIGTQADKLEEAMEGLQELIENMPYSASIFNTSKESIVESINSERITKGAVINSFENAKRLGLNEDVRKAIYDEVVGMRFEDLQAFQEQYVKGQKKIYLVIGSKDKLNFNLLKKYGKVEEMDLKELFGY